MTTTTAWTWSRSGYPAGGRAPGWNAGLVIARRRKTRSAACENRIELELKLEARARQVEVAACAPELVRDDGRVISRPSFLLAQLSDPHIGATWAGSESVARFSAAVDSVRAVRPQPDAVLVSGDLADHATDEEYEQVRELLAPLQAPLYVLPGNHDDRDALRRHFGVPGGAGEPVRYSVDLGPLRLVVLDTKRPGEDSGRLDAEQLDWLDSELLAAPEQLTLVAMHHPPIVTGIPVWDEIGLPPADRQALGDVIARHRQVRRLVAGHVHRTITGELAGRSVLTVPSTYVQARLNFAMQEIELSAEPAGFAVHAFIDGELISHVQPVH